MNKLFGVALAILLGLGMMFFFLARQRSGELDEPSVDQSAERARDAEAQMMEVENELEETRARVATLETELEEANAAIAEAEADDAAPAPEEVAEEEEAAEQEEDEKLDLDEIRQRLADSPQAAVQMQALAEMTYADFFSGIELESALKAALKETLTASQTESFALINYAMQLGDVTYSELSQWTNEERTRLDADMSNLLEGEDYAAWAAYQGDIEAHELENNLGRQIQMFASGLTPENLEMITQVAVEEFLVEQRVLMSSDLIVSQRENALWQLRAMEVMAERLPPLMEESQYSEYMGFHDMARNLLEGVIPPEDEE